ncbi:DUF3857 domain-containing protein [Flavobacterium rakeshii]|uniref:DUF3857 domain-containing protein n=1 Tax=Flavobacterium rakeshii TaxID=1038845 RepID=A0A6N8HAM1_9FLAO|nr:DUF3857 domain-containing protein [Flavobacterium rakeshii]MEE1897724.1 DUF3857 domain-containing protein [Flavobacterium rakeshii]MUV02615.1 DUF3857 domain-containing protein [Flavobacterium rakeshii]
MKIFKFFIFLFLTGYTTYAQKYELGEVTKEELAQKRHPSDSTAPAAILFSKGVTYMDLSERDGFTLVTEVDMKIKIYTKEGYAWANKAVSYYQSDNGDENVYFKKATTYNLVDGKVEKTKLKSEGEFDEEISKFYRQKKITMPDVKEGSIVEYHYEIRSPFTSIFPEWRFQESIPVNYSEYTTRIPEYYTFNPVFRGYLVPKVNRTRVNKKFTYTSSTRSKNNNYSAKTNYSTSEIDYTENVVTYIIENAPMLKGERFVNNIDNYTSSIEHELTMTQYPNETVKSYSHTWEDLAKTIYKNDDFGGELKKTNYFENDVDALIAGVTSPEEKIAILFGYVRDRMNWNDYYGYTCHDGIKQAYKNKTGNIAEINLMLTAMLNYAGLEANPVLVTTRSSKIALYPNRSAFNYVITSVELNGGIILLDASSKAALPNIRPIRSLNWEGRLIKKDGTSYAIGMLPQFNSKETVTIIGEISEDGVISGKARDQYFDYHAYVFRESYGGANQDSYLENLEKRYDGIEINDYTVAYDDFKKPVTEEYSFIHNNVTDVIGDKIYINPLLFFTDDENPFKQEKREYPIDFVFPTQYRYMINLKIPEGYQVESLPESLAIGMEDNIGSFKFTIQAQNNQIQLIAISDINYASVSPSYYTVLKDFYQKMVEKQAEKIVLTKKI